MKTLKINDMFSVVYDDEFNDTPKYTERLGSRHANIGPETPKWIIAMFYALLKYEQDAELVREANMEITTAWNDQTLWDQWSPGDI